jgi:hypothetical protein
MRLERREYLATYTVPRSIRVHSVSLVGRREPLALSPAIGLDGLLHIVMRVGCGVVVRGTRAGTVR